MFHDIDTGYNLRFANNYLLMVLMAKFSKHKLKITPEAPQTCKFNVGQFQKCQYPLELHYNYTQNTNRNLLDPDSCMSIIAGFPSHTLGSKLLPGNSLYVLAGEKCQYPH